MGTSYAHHTALFYSTNTLVGGDHVNEYVDFSFDGDVYASARVIHERRDNRYWHLDWRCHVGTAEGFTNMYTTMDGKLQTSTMALKYTMQRLSVPTNWIQGLYMGVSSDGSGYPGFTAAEASGITYTYSPENLMYKQQVTHHQAGPSQFQQTRPGMAFRETPLPPADHPISHYDVDSLPDHQRYTGDPEKIFSTPMHTKASAHGVWNMFLGDMGYSFGHGECCMQGCMESNMFHRYLVFVDAAMNFAANKPQGGWIPWNMKHYTMTQWTSNFNQAVYDDLINLMPEMALPAWFERFDAVPRYLDIHTRYAPRAAYSFAWGWQFKQAQKGQLTQLIIAHDEHILSDEVNRRTNRAFQRCMEFRCMTIQYWMEETRQIPSGNWHTAEQSIHTMFEMDGWQLVHDYQMDYQEEWRWTRHIHTGDTCAVKPPSRTVNCVQWVPMYARWADLWDVSSRATKSIAPDVRAAFAVNPFTNNPQDYGSAFSELAYPERYMPITFSAHEFHLGR